MIIMIIRGEWMANLRFSSVLLQPLKPITIREMYINIPDWVSLYINTFLWFLIHNDLRMMMAIEVCNLHDKVCTYYAAKYGSKN